MATARASRACSVSGRPCQQRNSRAADAAFRFPQPEPSTEPRRWPPGLARRFFWSFISPELQFSRSRRATMSCRFGDTEEKTINRRGRKREGRAEGGRSAMQSMKKPNRSAHPTSGFYRRRITRKFEEPQLPEPGFEKGRFADKKEDSGRSLSRPVPIQTMRAPAASNIGVCHRGGSTPARWYRSSRQTAGSAMRCSNSASRAVAIRRLTGSW